MIYPIPPIKNFNKDTVAYWENFLSDDEINKLLARPEWLNTSKASIGSSSENTTTDFNIRMTDVAWLDFTNETKELWEKFSLVIAEVNSRFFNFNLSGFYEPMQLTTYFSNNAGHYDWHVDGGNCQSAPRKLSMVLCLSDPSEFEGGELQIMDTSDKIKKLELKKGRAWFFPSYVLHRVTPVTKGVRRSLVVWIGGPDFK